MKKKSIIIILSTLVCLTSYLTSCDYITSNSEQQTDVLSDIQNSNDERIKELEAQILTILQSQQLSETERKKEITALKAELEALKKKETNNSIPTESESDEPKIFNYTLNGNKATITSINTLEENISSPAIIDGHAVTSIGSNAFSSTKVKRIVLEDGIENLDWFAFNGCSSLSTIYIPESVTSIGYGAFDGAPKSLIIECKKDSFAMKYAQSYGIKYEIK